eukprot:scaffold222412_cov59-Attheya_sp.AAC.2
MSMNLPSYAHGEYGGTMPLHHEFHVADLRILLPHYMDGQQTLNEIDANHIYYQENFQKYSTINAKWE